VGRNYEALRLVGDAKLTLAALSAELAKRDLSRRAAGRPAVSAASPRQCVGGARKSQESQPETAGRFGPSV